jgi:two-component system nitrate/nitrite sensor histidine kinase NarX
MNAVTDKRDMAAPASAAPPAPSGSLTASRLLVPLTVLAVILVSLVVGGFLMLKYPEWAGRLLTAQIVLLIIALAVYGVMLFQIQQYLMKPLAHLRDWAQQMRSGKLGTRIPVPAHGEFAALARDINSLGEALKTLSGDLDIQVMKQTERLAQKTRSLEVLYDVAASINVSRDLDDLLSRFLHTMCDVVDARAACVRLLDDQGMMRLVASIGVAEGVMERERIVPMSRCLPEPLPAGDGILWPDDIGRWRDYLQLTSGGLDDLEMVTVPLQYRGSTLGVYNLFINRTTLESRDDIRDLLTSIGRHLGMAIEKAHVDEEARDITIMQERTTLAHELHDSLAQTLASLRFQVRVLDETLQQSGEFTAIQEIELVENSLDEAYSELRSLIAHFRAPMDGRGLLPAIDGLVKRFRVQTGTSIFLQSSDWERASLPAAMEMQVFRVVQEALANIRKHSHANTVRVMLRCTADGMYTVLIEDDGVGFAEPILDGKPGEHIGLSIMQERAHKLSGELTIESEPGEGTTVELNFQYPLQDIETRSTPGKGML